MDRDGKDAEAKIEAQKVTLVQKTRTLIDGGTDWQSSDAQGGRRRRGPRRETEIVSLNSYQGAGGMYMLSRDGGEKTVHHEPTCSKVGVDKSERTGCRVRGRPSRWDRNKAKRTEGVACGVQSTGRRTNGNAERERGVASYDGFER